MKDYEIKSFKRFLKENGVLKSFYRHFNPDFFNSYHIYDETEEKVITIEDYLKKIKNYQVFLYAFDWKDAARMDSINDESFWANLEKKYLQEFYARI